MFVVVGTTTVDLLVSGLERIPEVGADEFTAENFAFCEEPPEVVLGGNGANSAYALAQMGVPVQLCSAVGRDRFGQIAADWLEEAGVDTEGLVRREDAATAITTVITDEVPRRLSFHHEGASRAFDISDVPEGTLQQADVLLISGYPLLKGWRPEGIAQAIETVHEAGGTTALDIGPALGQPVTLSELEPLLPHIDYLISNERELAVCTEEDDMGMAMEDMLRAGVHCLVVKQGSAGAIICWAGTPGGVEVPAFGVDARFTVGAGDTFNAALLFGLHQGRTREGALRFANAAAALVVSGDRGALGAPSVEEVEAFLRRSAV